MEETRKTIQKKLNHDEILKRVQLAMLRLNTVTYASNKRILQRRREEMKNDETMTDKLPKLPRSLIPEIHTLPLPKLPRSRDPEFPISTFRVSLG